MIYLMRHGQTDMNRERRLLGRTDIPLNDEGRREASEVRDSFKDRGVVFKACWSSPLIRAKETAEIVTGFPESEIITDDRLIEMDNGPYEGADLRNPPPEIRTFFSDFSHNPSPEGMEPLSEIVARMKNFLESLPYDGEGDILLLTHAIAMKGALEYLMPDSKGSWWNRFVITCAVFRFDKTNGIFTRPEEVKVTH